MQSNNKKKDNISSIEDPLVFAQQLQQAVADDDVLKFEVLMEERNAYLHNLTGEKRKEVLTSFVQSDRELASLLEKKKQDVQTFLLTQNNQLRAMKTYDQF